MTDVGTTPSPNDYRKILAEYLEHHSESALYHGSLLSQSFIVSGLGPEDIVALHVEALEETTRGWSHLERSRAGLDAHQFLLEIMINYGAKFKEYLENRLSEAITDSQIRIQREHERALEAERLQRERSEILGMVAHELRGPITLVKGNLDLAARLLSQGKIDPVTGHIGSARDAVDRLSRLTGDLVEASRGHALFLERRPLNLTASVVQACLWAAPGAASKQINLVYSKDPDIPVYGNADGLLSIFGNLLSNAIRYTATGATVTVRQGIDGGDAWVEIVDTGIGMTPEVQARIFEKFYRAPEARDREARGLGLGLSLVQQMVAEHDGRIEVESTPGRGSTFRVILPLYQETLVAEPQASESSRTEDLND